MPRARTREDATYTRLRRPGTALGELLERWMAAASPDWAASTVRETRSLIRCHLDPHLGHLPVAKLTTADIDDFYAHLLRAVDATPGPSPPAPCTACTSCCIGP